MTQVEEGKKKSKVVRRFTSDKNWIMGTWKTILCNSFQSSNNKIKIKNKNKLFKIKYKNKNKK